MDKAEHVFEKLALSEKLLLDAASKANSLVRKATGNWGFVKGIEEGVNTPYAAKKLRQYYLFRDAYQNKANENISKLINEVKGLEKRVKVKKDLKNYKTTMN